MRRHHGRAPSPYAGRTAAPLSAEVSLVRNFDSKVNPTRPVRQSPLATSQIQGMPLDLIDRIRSFPLFRSAPDTFLYEIGLMLKPQMHSPNDYIITEGGDAKAMFWVVRGAVAVTSRDGESTYAELKPGSFVGEIGILMDRPRTATVIARTRCLTLQLKKEDLRKLLPRYPEVEQALREEALERLAILEKKKVQSRQGLHEPPPTTQRRGSKRARELQADEMDTDTAGKVNGTSKRRKSPSPGMNEVTGASALGHGLVNVRALLKEMPLFASLPPDMLHFLGLNAHPRDFPPFVDIVKQDSTGKDVFFIVHGEVEVLDERPVPRSASRRKSTKNGNENTRPSQVKARLKSGQYFGEVASLALSDRRTATVRSVTPVECLVITEDVLTEFWELCPVPVRQQIENTAHERLKAASEDDAVMTDADAAPSLSELMIGDQQQKRAGRPPAVPKVAFNDAEVTRPVQPIQKDESTPAEPLDPDPFQSTGLDKVRARSRRGSLAPMPLEEQMSLSKTIRRSPRGSPKSSPTSHTPSPRGSAAATPSPVSEERTRTSFFSDPFTNKPRLRPRHPSLGQNRGIFPDQILPFVLQHLRLHELMRLQAVSVHWQNILTKSPVLFHDLDLSAYNRRVTDANLINRICPFVGARPRVIDVSNCFHITDEGFTALANTCGTNVTVWRMKSVWDVTAPAILEMSNRARGLRKVDLSNCRKVSDALLARIVGWVVPPSQPSTGGGNGYSLGRHHSLNGKRPTLNTKLSGNASPPAQLPPGTIVGCHLLSHLTLSYCKHITDRTMHHLAANASQRLAHLDLTRCTTITDTGFSYWGQSNIQFPRLTTLILADCTYLSDQAIIYLVNAAGQSLRRLDLSFCCALSDTSIEVIALGCPNLEFLNVSFCGSAVSDASLRSIGHHLTRLTKLAVRGCVRVTGQGVDAVVDGCHRLSYLDVSQCRNLYPWIEGGGVQRWRARGRSVEFDMMK